jgi:TonB family protein
MIIRLTILSAACVIALPLALLGQNAFSTVTGSIVDQSGASLPGVAVAAYNTTRGSRQEVTTDAYGRFELVGLAEGSYTLEADLPGFETFQQKLTLNGQDVSRDITLRIGSLEEVITVTNDPNSSPAAPSERYPPRPANCGQATGRNGGANVRIGGQIRTPRKIHHVSPIYPQGVQPGVVKIEAVIGTEGLVTETKVTNGASEALARAAVAAVQQWEFDPTLLNCEAVDVRMTVTVEFR